MKKDIKKVLAISILSMGVLLSAPSALCVPSGAKNTSGMYTFTGNIKIIKYPPGSFDAERFNAVLKINGIEEDLRNASRIVEVDPMSNEKTVRVCGNEWECVIKPFNGKYYHVEYINKLEANEKTNKKILFLFSPTASLINDVGYINGLIDDCGLREFIDVKNTLQKIIIPRNIREICSCAFRGYKALKKIKIPASIRLIDSCAFCGCEALEKIEIPNSVTEIGEHAFYYCKSLKEITIPNSVKSIEDSTFDDCKSLKEITIPNSVKSIGFYAFSGCTSLERVEFPADSKIKFIGEGAFNNCESLKEIEIPNSVTEICQNAFDGCPSLKEIKWNGNTYGVGEFFKAFNNRLKS